MEIAVTNSIQNDIFNMISFIKDEKTLVMLKNLISDFFAQKADEELNRLWDEGVLNDDKIESFRNLHERTSYK